MKTDASRYAPIALFIFRRPLHTERTIRSLMACPEFANSPLFIFADGPRGPEDEVAVNQARSVVRSLVGDRAMYIESAKNVGLAASVIKGVTEVCERHGRVIVVEDDLQVANVFLQYMNRALDSYATRPEVMQVSGHIVDTPELQEVRDAQFLPFISSWGWATWKRAWDVFDPAASGWENLVASVRERRKFDLDGSYPYSRMLRRQMTGKLDSWAVRWYYAVFVRGGMTLFPPTSLVHNIGLDGSGTHSSQNSRVRQKALPDLLEIALPEEVEESQYKQAVFRSLRSNLFRMRMRKLTSRMTGLVQTILRPV